MLLTGQALDKLRCGCPTQLLGWQGKGMTAIGRGMGSLEGSVMVTEDSVRNELVRLVDSRRGHFALESGDHGDLWLDLDRLFLAPSALTPSVSRLAGRLSGFAFDAVCGPLSGGAFLAQLIASELDVMFCYTERRVHAGVASDNTRHPVEYRLPDGLVHAVAGTRVAIVDDAINAGHAVGGTIAALLACGAELVVVGALLVLGESAKSPDWFAGLPLRTIAPVPSALWRAEACPLCARGVPIERPGWV